MVLVQKLTGLSRSSDDNSTEKCNGSSEEENNDSNNNNIKSCKIAGKDDESTSVITTDENCSGGNIDDGQIFCARIISSFIITQLIRCFSRRISEGQFCQHIRQQLKA
ncbi:uncharacterized protein LOC18046768 [Citrus clementina]|uniref:uncharacterized protein LOC18046768 n=1 Tax=Citrus clementina TaxID=85681 RepID=UPI000CECE70B|nr:uncharacterized protein LOC18046768 [Citrus x clementina]